MPQFNIMRFHCLKTIRIGVIFGLMLMSANSYSQSVPILLDLGHSYNPLVGLGAKGINGCEVEYNDKIGQAIISEFKRNDSGYQVLLSRPVGESIDEEMYPDENEPLLYFIEDKLWDRVKKSKSRYPLSFQDLYYRSVKAYEEKAALTVSIHHDSVASSFLNQDMNQDVEACVNLSLDIADSIKEEFLQPYSDGTRQMGFSIFVTKHRGNEEVHNYSIEYKRSVEFAKELGRQLIMIGRLPSKYVRDRGGFEVIDSDLGIYHSRLAVLRGSPGPSLLVEIGYISSQDDERIINNDSFRSDFSRALFNSVNNLKVSEAWADWTESTDLNYFYTPRPVSRPNFERWHQLSLETLGMACGLLPSIDEIRKVAEALERESLVPQLEFSDEQNESIFQAASRVEEFETLQDDEKLIFWSPSEEFPSLGIGHFIWYARGKEGKYQESFPAYIRFVRDQIRWGRLHKEVLPAWLDRDIVPGFPWSSRSEFIKAKDSRKYQDLYKFLRETKSLQVAFIAHQFKSKIYEVLAAEFIMSGHDSVSGLIKSIQGLFKTKRGIMAVLDYTHFKGTGADPKESVSERAGRPDFALRYQWGLRQVLSNMNSEENPDSELIELFKTSAKNVLQGRVKRQAEVAVFLRGWERRIDQY